MAFQSRKNYEDMQTVTWPTTLSENLVAKLKARKEETGVSVAAQIRRAIEKDLGGLGVQDLIDAGLKNFRGPYLSTVPCGDWETAIELAEDFVLSEDIANELDAREGDVFVRTQGQSMEGQGIYDHAVLLVRPVESKHPPRKGDAVVVQITMEDGTYLGTLKQWTGNGTPPELLDGDGNAFSYPDGVASVEPVAVVKGVIWRYS